MKLLIELAFGVREGQIVSKLRWLDDTYYDIEAKPSGDEAQSYDVLKPMLQQLLGERFHLTVHRETRWVRGYSLALINQSRAPTPSNKPSTQVSIYDNAVRGQGMSISTLAGTLSHILERPVADQTGLTGNFDVDLKFAGNKEADSSLPSLFTALQEQLGLKLSVEPRVPVELLMVDEASKEPTAN